MGREIRRVPLDFNHPLEKVWDGFLNPYCHYSHTCEACDGRGLNPATKKLYDDWYDSDGFYLPGTIFGGEGRWTYRYDNGRAVETIERYPGACRRWCDKLTQDEVNALAEGGRLHEFTHDWVLNPDSEKGFYHWVPKSDPLPQVPAEIINMANSVGAGGFGHDAINCWICVETRAKRLGVYGKCEVCHGSGEILEDEELKKKYEAWERTPPPEGEGWQVWETVSEGSPITPVYPTAEALIERMVTIGINWGASEGPYSREAAEAFVKRHGWAPTMVGISGVGLIDGIQATEYLPNNMAQACLLRKEE